MRHPRAVKALLVVCAALLCSALRPVALLTQSRVSAQATPSGESFDDLFLRGRQTVGGVKTLTARFTETTTSVLLTRPLVAHGTLAVERPSRVVMRFTEPDQRVILIDGDRMTTVWPSRSLRQTSNIASSQARIQKYLAAESAAELRKQFDITHRDSDERSGALEVTLIPKRSQIRDTLPRLDLRVDRMSFVLTEIRLNFATGDTKTMTFEDVALNVPLKPETFSVDR